MTKRHIIAVAVAVTAMVLALAQPLWISSTGTEVALGLRPVDPLSLLRGNYVDLDYEIDIAAPAELGWRQPVYVVFDDERPANALRASSELPDLAPGETCIQGETRGSGRIEFPALEQYFVTPEQGGRLERDLGNMVGVIKTTGGCRSILVDIQPA